MYYYYNYWLFLLLLLLLFFSPLIIVVVVFVCIDFLICNFHLLLVKVWDTTVFVYGLNLVFYKIKAKISLRTFFQMRSPVAPLLLLFLVLLLLSFELKNRFNSSSAVLFVYTERTIEPVMRSLPTTGPLFSLLRELRRHSNVVECLFVIVNRHNDDETRFSFFPLIV